MGRRSKQIPIAVDQFVNTLFGGRAGETISSVAWRKRKRKRQWAITRRVIDALFFWQKDHCQTAYESELQRRHLPPELRG